MSGRRIAGGQRRTCRTLFLKEILDGLVTRPVFVVLLFVLGILTFAGAYASFLRYDLR